MTKVIRSRAVFIAAPFTGYSWVPRDRPGMGRVTLDVSEELNLRRARALAALACREGLAPVVPALSCDVFRLAFRDPVQAEKAALERGITLAATVAKAGGLLWLLFRDDGTISPGCRGEIDEFKRMSGVSPVRQGRWDIWGQVFVTDGMGKTYAAIGALK